MIRRRLIRSSAILASSIASLVPHGPARAEDGKLTRQLRESVLASPDVGFNGSPLVQRLLSPGTGFDGSNRKSDPPKPQSSHYAWKTGIVTTTFWVGERATKNNPVPNHASSWDPAWAKAYGGTDDPENRAEYLPAKFVPKQNPFYVALPYNDVTKGRHKPEASRVVPWFKEAFERDGKSVLKGRWIAIRYNGKIAYAQWEDCGPFRTDHWQYVFGDERPKPNLNKGAGLDVSPAVRDYLGMNGTDVTDWKFVEFSEVPNGPWSTLGENNTFVINRRTEESRVVSADKKQTTPNASVPMVLVSESLKDDAKE